MLKIVKTDELEFILENFHDFFLEKTNELGDKVYNFEKNLIL